MKTETTERLSMNERIKQHGERLLSIFPKAKERDPVKLCKKLRSLEARAQAVAVRLCNGPEYPGGYEEVDKITDAILANVNTLLGNVHEYQPKTGAKCGCRRGVQRDNCSACEGTGYAVDFHAIRNRQPLVPVFISRDPRGHALKIEDSWIAAQRADHRTAYKAAIHQDWGGYGIIAPDLSDDE